MRNHKRLIAASLSVAFAAALAGCGGGGSGGGSGSALDGVKLTVGSKDFTENILVGEMYVQALQNEGADVTSQTNLGGTSVARDALLNKEIDVYPEYTGTGWTVHLGNEKPSQDPAELFKVTSEQDIKDNDIAWVGQSPFNDTYGFAANGDLAKEEGPFDFDSMAAYLKANPDTTVCMETEFPDRPDGLVLWEKATGYKIPQSQIQILDTGLIYTETSDGKCDFGEVFTTDGRIQALNLELVEDPGVMILYNLSMTWQDAVYQEHAETYKTLADEIFKDLDEEKMAELNALVDVEGQPVEQVAKKYLEDIGLL
ncbi:glycine betaine ABC transporter substrate-binding protein [Nocardioides aurantiacus]|uniref:Osmoprotectant transport system substrate-binding protein n=1 Tax=Nocardioides aurantiacus TaxID=86796 RepID=A0A3N2CZB6_9ACTN|nr:glycine betaine ABC transporter substrate-binding protein [Nocardioides aurantiacus]ROR92836.1 osmoprotectant transport system substrate-binding protein [Nocardioides aurantiacus]